MIPGHLTHTVYNKVVTCLRFLVLHHLNIGGGYSQCFKALAIKLWKPTEYQLSEKQPASLQNLCKLLGYVPTSNINTIKCVTQKQHPQYSLVFDKLFRPWCMEPV